MDAGIVSVFGVLGGVLLGFLLNEITAHLRQRGEDKRRLRRALFNLMNLHHLTAPPNLTQASSTLHEWIQSNDPDTANSYTTEQLREFLQQFIEPLVVPLRQEALQSLCGSYEQTIVDIATIDPLLAFSLSGRSRTQSDIRRYLSSVETLFGTGTPAPEDSGDIAGITAAARDFYDSHLRDTLEDDIRAVARRIGRITRFRVYRFLKRKRVEADIELKQKLFALLDELVSRTRKPGTR